MIKQGYEGEMMALVEKVYLINEKHKHNSVKSKYLSVKRVTCDKISFRVLDHNICERTLTYKDETFKLAYCIDCDSYGVNFQYYYNIKNDNIECLIRINTFRCNIRKHNIEEVMAIVNVFKKIQINQNRQK